MAKKPARITIKRADGVVKVIASNRNDRGVHYMTASVTLKPADKSKEALQASMAEAIELLMAG